MLYSIKMDSKRSKSYSSMTGEICFLGIQGVLLRCELLMVTRLTGSLFKGKYILWVKKQGS